MDRQTFTLGRILGIPVGVDLSWLLIFALLTWLLAAGYYPDQFRTWPVALYWLAGALTAIVFFISVLLHELGHSLVARSYHIPVRKITLYIFGGISQIEDEPHNAREEFWVAIAGPAVSLVLAGFFFALGRNCARRRVHRRPESLPGSDQFGAGSLQPHPRFSAGWGAGVSRGGVGHL